MWLSWSWTAKKTILKLNVDKVLVEQQWKGTVFNIYIYIISLVLTGPVIAIEEVTDGEECCVGGEELWSYVKAVKAMMKLVEQVGDDDVMEAIDRNQEWCAILFDGLGYTTEGKVKPSQ